MPIKTGDYVVMHTVAESEKHKGLLWKVISEPYMVGKREMVFLEGYRGSFATQYLQVVEYDPMNDLNEIHRRIDKLNEVKQIQGRKGNYDYDSGNCGIYNGLELAASILERRDANFANRIVCKQCNSINYFMDDEQQEKCKWCKWPFEEENIHDKKI
ncbi:hypothetical protein [Listeria rocourtiae]|uniref:hypothetical protein n=1 Tax=Listeria rocourtiae TaxID=647910 RepID=UPI003D2F7DC1